MNAWLLRWVGFDQLSQGMNPALLFAHVMSCAKRRFDLTPCENGGAGA
jgi:hypothetical protein